MRGLTDTRTSSDQRSGRDLRVDFFRGLALLFIFLDHVPNNAAAWLTVRNFGFSDAAEIFVFLSGYSAALAYYPRIERGGLCYGIAATLHRAWRIYVAHVFLLIVSIVLVLLVTDYFANPDYLQEMNLVGFRAAPLESLLQSLLLRFRAGNMDVLPLYVLLMACAAPMLGLMRRWPGYTLGAAALLWMLAAHFNWNLGTYPQGGAWLFNPFCWQFLFVIGSACALHPARLQPLFAARRWLLPLALLYLGTCFALVLTWYFPRLEPLVPDWLARTLYPINKSNLDMLRLVHFLALAYLASSYVPRRAPWLQAAPARALVLCGQHSLPIFCLGIVLAFLAHVCLVQIGSSVGMQYFVSACGCMLLIATASVLNWYKTYPLRPRATYTIQYSEST